MRHVNVSVRPPTQSDLNVLLNFVRREVKKENNKKISKWRGLLGLRTFYNIAFPVPDSEQR
jgi:hypothetical protein